MSVVAATLPLPAQSCLGALQDQITTTTATTTTTTATSPLPPRSRGRNDRQWRAKNATLTKRTPPPASQGQERECVESLSEPVADSIIEESLVRRGDEPAQGVELSMRAISDISLGDALDSFLAGSLGEVTEEFGDDWCTDSKLSTSVFDEDEILGDGGSSMLRQMISQTLAKLPCRKDAITAEVDKLNEQCQADDYEGPPVAAPLDDKELAVMDAMMKQRMISARENLNYAGASAIGAGWSRVPRPLAPSALTQCLADRWSGDYPACTRCMQDVLKRHSAAAEPLFVLFVAT
eukprot:CAMPEP_0206579262 /NCGR_PEP_ID=MMETSP0325_2-20121206/32451_1 /ASSEMBLY_ACC=CAM_ASM_000347 /TAXON_ID=2866 /ORGANISM="Crypthecodinium cohnii, Strain Seligo" /LENGTH=292 /DNA_ID=CAMNT_0054085053 /DNA_START=191 /DNA_END=1066 /DNA_ORIENTATION=-